MTRWLAACGLCAAMAGAARADFLAIAPTTSSLFARDINTPTPTYGLGAGFAGLVTYEGRSTGNFTQGGLTFSFASIPVGSVVHSATFTMMVGPGTGELGVGLLNINSFATTDPLIGLDKYLSFADQFGGTPYGPDDPATTLTFDLTSVAQGLAGDPASLYGLVFTAGHQSSVFLREPSVLTVEYTPPVHAVPEPASLGLAGLAGIVAVGWRIGRRPRGV